MGKFPFKRPRIISKKFPEIDSTIDGVTKSLDSLVFSYHDQVEKALQKKHLMMAFSSMVLLLVLGSFISPKGKAESAVFYPDSCLGGWVNPQHAQGELETTSNGDESQFTGDNSAILPKNTNADMYCGNFKGVPAVGTRPVKIVVSLALTKGADLLLQDTIVGSSFASSSQKILDTASTTDISFTLASTTSATSTASSSKDVAPIESTTSTTTPVISPQAPASAFGSVLQSVSTLLGNFLNSSPTPSQTDTVIVPPPVSNTSGGTSSSSEQTASSTSYLKRVNATLLSYFFDTVLAQESTSTTNVETSTTSLFAPIDTPSAEQQVATTTAFSPVDTPSTTQEVVSVSSSSVPALSSSTLSSATTSDVVIAGDGQLQNNFLEVFYTFDGVTWTSLGELNEISMKYRTFEIPVTSTTTWGSIAQLQVKIAAKKRLDENPTVYLDGIKVDVLYETVIPHDHPDFARDTIMKDTSDDGVRVVSIVNSDTGNNEIWYTTIGAQEGYGVAPGSWVQVSLDQISPAYRLIDIYGQNIFWVDDKEKMLWVTNLQKATNDGTGLNESTSTLITKTQVASSTNASTTDTIIVTSVITGSTTVPFTKVNGEEWVFEYNAGTKMGIARIKN